MELNERIRGWYQEEKERAMLDAKEFVEEQISRFDDAIFESYQKMGEFALSIKIDRDPEDYHLVLTYYDNLTSPGFNHVRLEETITTSEDFRKKYAESSWVYKDVFGRVYCEEWQTRRQVLPGGEKRIPLGLFA